MTDDEEPQILESHNYTGILNRDKRIYTLDDISLGGATGLSAATLVTAIPTYLIAIVIGIIITQASGVNMFLPADTINLDGINTWRIIACFTIYILPWIIASSLNNIKVHGFKLKTYIAIWFNLWKHRNHCFDIYGNEYAPRGLKLNETIE